jgi:hypothetical protein
MPGQCAVSKFARLRLSSSDDADDELVTSSVGVMQAIISIFADDNDRIRYINAGSYKISFLLRAPLYHVCVSDYGEPESIVGFLSSCYA